MIFLLLLTSRLVMASALAVFRARRRLQVGWKEQVDWDSATMCGG